ncbi:uncharacterized protein BT62DRAFT_974991 [Guyanagaster necrorhizus]|uniref:F-box domain-containing protein n=1 Tax=Guyanagaster necrorhizus TaxID=856835 RepID=A0A9P7VJ25_9AGAR|nr:uncharacterized protein BT62DRAFT_974991 [Guyanagaster necrorhizus MCA 3950]KAG7441270.1 hypothetical protein BT62DRAFT_974991 [Guyanagaster necrorhizus MCA 3950]
MNFTLLADDVLIYTIAYLSVPDILLLRQTCKLFNALTRLPIVWTNAHKLDILSNDYPFPLDDSDLEQRTRHAYRLASRWLADSALSPKSETTFTGSPVSEIKFVSGRQHKWLLTVSKVIWSVLMVWDIARGQKCSEWSPKGAIFTGVSLNDDAESEASLAVSFAYVYRSQKIILLRLDDAGTLHEIGSIDIDLRPVNLTGDVLALTDDTSVTLIHNWKTGEQTYLDTPPDHCIQIVLTPPTVLVVRARSIALYALPSSTPLSTHSFGWVDGASATTTSILIRSENDNPWASELNSLQLYALSSFPPTLISRISSRRGALRCPDIILGKRGTAVWIRPHDRALVSHWEEQENSCETLMTAVFPGSLNHTENVRVRDVCMNTLNNWTALDYDEDLGRIALGSGFGKITVVQL